MFIGAQKQKSLSVKMSRNYQHSVELIGKNIWNAVSGKFPLGFSLAVLALEKVIGKKPLPLNQNLTHKVLMCLN